MAVAVRPGSRVYWHGVFPEPETQGTIVRTGRIRHEVRWDDQEHTNLVHIDAVGKIVRGKHVCPDGGCGRCP